MKNFETVSKGPFAGELVRLPISAGSIILRPLPNPRLTASGYGDKIPTPYMVRTVDSRWRRVYCRIYSNVGTLYVMHGKTRTIVTLPCS